MPSGRRCPWTASGASSPPPKEPRSPRSWGGPTSRCRAAGRAHRGRSADLVARGGGPQWDLYDGARVARAWYQRQVTDPGGMARPRDQPALRPRVHGRDRLCQRHGVRKNRLAVGLRGHHASGNARPDGGDPGAGGGHRRCRNRWGPSGRMPSATSPTPRPRSESRGLTGSVFLESRSSEARVTDVFVRTSTRKKDVSLDVELDRRQAGGPGSGRRGHARRKGRGGEELRGGRGGGGQGDADRDSLVALGRPAPVGRGPAQPLHPPAESEGRGPG